MNMTYDEMIIEKHTKIVAAEDFIIKLLANMSEEQLDDLDNLDMTSTEMQAAAKHLKVLQKFGSRKTFCPEVESLNAYIEGDEELASALEEDASYEEPEVKFPE